MPVGMPDSSRFPLPGSRNDNSDTRGFEPTTQNRKPATENRRASASILAFDYGAARTGVAAGNALTGTAQPLAPLDTRDTGRLPVTLKKLLREWRPARLIVGLPLSMDGEKTATGEAAAAFAERLRELSGLPVELHDERLTSREAAARFREARQGGRARRKQSRQLDSMAAALILESWFEDNKLQERL